MLELKSVKANTERENAGDWIEYPDWPGVAFKVRSLNFPAYTTERDVAYQRLARVHKGKIPAADLTKTMGSLFAKHLLLDWRGINPAYTPEVAEETLSDPDYREVVAAVQWCAAEVARVEAEFVEGEVKN